MEDENVIKLSLGLADGDSGAMSKAKDGCLIIRKRKEVAIGGNLNDIDVSLKHFFFYQLRAIGLNQAT